MAAKQVFSFECPYCSVTLRLREVSLIGQSVSCPDCDGLVAIALDAEGTVRGACCDLLVDTKRNTHLQNKAFSRIGRVAHRVQQSSSCCYQRCRRLVRIPTPIIRAWRCLKNPVGVAWCVIVVCIGLMVAAVSPRDSRHVRTGLSAAESASQTVSDRSSLGVRDPNLAHTAETQTTPALETQGKSALERRILRFHAQTASHHKEHGSLPRGTVHAENLPYKQRFSWLAVLANRLPTASVGEPLWERSWRDPLNNRFVRQRIESFQNPAISVLASEDGYPATHFVGVAGIGDDAALLAPNHPRAGVFGFDRGMCLDEIPDGASNTIAVMGVQQNLGAWAAGGPATIRSLTGEPYVRGPDGFGTGQADSMVVLLADGSVRVVSDQTSPNVLRRMAAMADGPPEDVTVAQDTRVDSTDTKLQ
jgi:hypothetical protein